MQLVRRSNMVRGQIPCTINTPGDSSRTAHRRLEFLDKSQRRILFP